MQIGSSITIGLHNEQKSNENIYRSKVIDQDEKFFYVDIPINVRTNKTKIIPLHEPISVNYVVNEVAFQFNTSVDKRVKLTVDALAIPIPDISSIKKIQRREFVRIKTDIDVAMYFSNRATPPIISVTYDISGGGAAVVLPPNVQIDDKQPIILYLVLPTSSSQYEYMKIDATIVRFYKIDKVKLVSLQFHLHSEKVREKIINYCFKVQREKRKQELI